MSQEKSVHKIVVFIPVLALLFYTMANLVSIFIFQFYGIGPKYLLLSEIQNNSIQVN